MSLAGTIEDLAGVGVTGSVAVAEAAGMTAIDVELASLPEGMYQASLVAGDCEALGESVAALGDLGADASGDVMQTYSVTVPVDTIAGGRSLVIEDEAAELVACADLA